MIMRSYSQAMDYVTKHESIPTQHIESMNCVNNDVKFNVVTMLAPDNCELYIKQPKENQQTELEGTEVGDFAVKNEEIKMEVVNKYDNYIETHDNRITFQAKILDDDIHRGLKSERAAFAESQLKIKDEFYGFTCTICLEEFSKELTYHEHMSMHLQNFVSADDESNPRAAVSSSSDASLVLENKQTIRRLLNDLHPSLSNNCTETAADNNMQIIKGSNEKVLEMNNLDNQPDGNIKKNSFACFVKLYDIFKTAKKALGEESLTKSGISVCENRKIDAASKVFRSTNKMSRSAKKLQTECLKINERKQKRLNFFNKLRKNILKQKKYLVLQMKTHTSKTLFSCELCNYKSSIKSYLDSHMRTHSAEKPFTCEMCNFKSSSKGYLVIHMKTHTGEKPFSCKICDYKCSRKSYLVSHTRTHNSGKPFSCTICNYQCSAKCNFAAHMKTHTGNTIFSCELCIYKSSIKSYLDSHMRIHSAEKPFTCEICNYKSSRKNYLVVHMKTHTDDKPFSCTICNYKCSRKSYLVSHTRTHTGEKPFSCQFCDYKSSNKSNLAVHMKTHTGKKPFSCEMCSFKCSTKCNLAAHMRTHASE